jgi:hypothetical protein
MNQSEKKVFPLFFRSFGETMPRSSRPRASPHLCLSIPFSFQFCQLPGTPQTSFANPASGAFAPLPLLSPPPGLSSCRRSLPSPLLLRLSWGFTRGFLWGFTWRFSVGWVGGTCSRLTTKRRPDEGKTESKTMRSKTRDNDGLTPAKTESKRSKNEGPTKAEYNVQ